MNDKMDFFENGDYRLITNLINDKMEKLKNIKILVKSTQSCMI